MLEWMHDPDCVSLLQSDFMSKTADDCLRFIDYAQTAGDDLHLAIADGDDTYMGTVSLKHIDKAAGRAEFAISIRRCAMGTGISTAAMAEIIRMGLGELGLREIYWCVSPENRRAVRFYDKNSYPRVPADSLCPPGYTPEQVQSYIWYCVKKQTENAPTLSVVVPVYKAEKHLCQCVDALLSQTLKEIEIILVDDGSPDSSGSICDRYAESHPNIKVIHKENQGQTPARQDGLRAATGEYIAFCDSDDWPEPDMYEKMLSRLQKEHADMIITGYLEEWENRTEPRSNRLPDGVYRDADLQQLRLKAVFDLATDGPAVSLSLWTKLFRREDIRDVFLSIPGQLRFGEDALCVWGLLANARCVIIDNAQKPYHYRCWEGSITQRYYPDYARDLFYLKQQLDTTYGNRDPLMDQAIAHYYIQSLLHGVTVEGSRLNPAGFLKKCQGIRAFCSGSHLSNALRLADLKHYDSKTRFGLRLLNRRAAFLYLLHHKLCNLWSKLFHH